MWYGISHSHKTSIQKALHEVYPESELNKCQLHHYLILKRMDTTVLPIYVYWR